MEAKFKKYQMITPIVGANTIIPYGRFVVCREDAKSTNIVSFQTVDIFGCNPVYDTSNFRLVKHGELLERLTDEEIREAAFHRSQAYHDEQDAAKVIAEYRELEKLAIKPEAEGFVPQFRKGDRIRQPFGRAYTCACDSFLTEEGDEVVKADELKSVNCELCCSQFEKVEEGSPSTILGTKPPIKDMPQPIDLGACVPVWKVKPPMRKLLPLVWKDGKAWCKTLQETFEIKPRIEGEAASNGECVVFDLFSDDNLLTNGKDISFVRKWVEGHRNRIIATHFE